MIVLLAHTLTCYYAYALAVNALGYRNFGSDDYFWSMVKSEGKEVRFPSYTFYRLLAGLTLMSIIAFPLVVVINFALHRCRRQVTFERRIVLITLSVIIIFRLFFESEVFNWFFLFVFD